MLYTYYYTYITYKTRICTHTRVYIESVDYHLLTDDKRKNKAK